MVELKDLEALAEGRIQLAYSRKLPEKMSIILGQFGLIKNHPPELWSASSESELFYNEGNLLIRRITRSGRLSDSYGDYGSYSNTWREVLFRKVKCYGDTFVLAAGGNSFYRIDSYIPGEWEKGLKKLYTAAQEIIAENEKQKREMEKRWQAAEEQRRAGKLKISFGL